MEDEIQFDHVETSTGSLCASCRQGLPGFYFQTNGQMFCQPCSDALRRLLTGREGALGRLIKAAGLGICGGLGGAILYTAILAFAHINLSLITILIGWMTGKMVRKGSGGRGGAAYQLLAVLITYLMIGASLGASELVSASVEEDMSPLGAAFLIGFAAIAGPVLHGMSSLMGALITVFGLFEAWRLNAPLKLSITGPHPIASPAPAASTPSSLAPLPTSAEPSGPPSAAVSPEPASAPPLPPPPPNA